MPIPSPDEVTAASQYLDLAQQAIQHIEDETLLLQWAGSRMKVEIAAMLHQVRCLRRNLSRISREVSRREEWERGK